MTTEHPLSLPHVRYRKTAEDKRIDAAVGARIKALRKARKITQVEMAEFLGHSMQQYWMYENGHGSLRPYLLLKIAGQFGVSVSHLVGENVDVAPFTQDDLRRAMAEGIEKLELIIAAAQIEIEDRKAAINRLNHSRVSSPDDATPEQSK